MPSPARIVPTYDFYGEPLVDPASAAVHYEGLRERSSRHDWTIRLHRHRRFAQIFLFRTPGVFVRVGDLDYHSRAPMVLFVPPQVAHGFRFAEDVSGDVLTLRMDRLDGDVADRLAHACQGRAAILADRDTAHFAAITDLIAQAQVVAGRPDAARDNLLLAIARLIATYILTEVERRSGKGVTTPPSDMTRGERQCHAFCAAVDTHFASEMTVPDYAALLGLSAPHLTRQCNRYLGLSPSALIRRRRIAEARQLLTFTRHAIGDVGFRSGFRDPAFFARAFKAAVGVTPRKFRDDAG